MSMANLPKVVSSDEWLVARRELLAQEKELTRHRDEVNAARRRLPMVEITKNYVFDGPHGKTTLMGLFDGRSQLLIYHFMFEPDEDEGCPSCSFWIDNVGHLSHLHARDTSFAAALAGAVGQAQSATEKRMGWTIPLVLIERQRFQLRLPHHPGRDRRAGAVQLQGPGPTRTRRPPAGRGWSGEQQGASAFLRHGDRAFQHRLRPTSAASTCSTAPTTGRDAHRASAARRNGRS